MKRLTAFPGPIGPGRIEAGVEGRLGGAGFAFPGPIGPGRIEAKSAKISTKLLMEFPGPIGPGRIEATARCSCRSPVCPISRPNWAGPH